MQQALRHLSEGDGEKHRKTFRISQAYLFVCTPKIGAQARWPCRLPLKSSQKILTEARLSLIQLEPDGLKACQRAAFALCDEPQHPCIATCKEE